MLIFQVRPGYKVVFKFKFPIDCQRLKIYIQESLWSAPKHNKIHTDKFCRIHVNDVCKRPNLNFQLLNICPFLLAEWIGWSAMFTLHDGSTDLTSVLKHFHTKAGDQPVNRPNIPNALLYCFGPWQISKLTK